MGHRPFLIQSSPRCLVFHLQVMTHVQEKKSPGNEGTPELGPLAPQPGLARLGYMEGCSLLWPILYVADNFCFWPPLPARTLGDEVLV